MASVEAKLAFTEHLLADGLEYLLDRRVGQGVEDLPSGPAGGDEAAPSQAGQMVGDAALPATDGDDEVAHVAFSDRELLDDEQAGSVRQHLEIAGDRTEVLPGGNPQSPFR
jgi:hypothetical protein